MLSIGAPAPDFTLTLPDGLHSSLAALLRDGPIVLYFYPADFTPVCTAEACMFRDMEGELLSRGVRVVGVSPQDEESHARFRDQFRLAFPLVADPQRTVIHAYGAHWPFGIGIRRVSYLIGRDGNIADRVVAEFSVEEHTAFVRRVIDAAGSQTSTTQS